MQIGCQQFCIDPPFPVNRMLREEKHQAVSGHLYCRIAALYPENDLPFYHVSIDTVELWKDREDRITQVITEALGRDMEDHVTAESLQEILDNAREDLVLMNALVLDADCEEDE